MPVQGDHSKLEGLGCESMQDPQGGPPGDVCILLATLENFAFRVIALKGFSDFLEICSKLDVFGFLVFSDIFSQCSVLSDVVGHEF